MALAPQIPNLGSAPSSPVPGLSVVSVGPGDPELLTVAAVRAIQAAAVVAYPVAREGASGMAPAAAVSDGG